LWNSLAEEIFFFLYNLNLPMEDSMKLPINLRKWLIQRFVDQKEKENEQMEAERRKAKSKR
jgi:hypothetical protein